MIRWASGTPWELIALEHDARLRHLVLAAGAQHDDGERFGTPHAAQARSQFETTQPPGHHLRGSKKEM